MDLPMESWVSVRMPGIRPDSGASSRFSRKLAILSLAAAIFSRCFAISS